MKTKNEKIIMANGLEIEVDETPHYIKNHTLYVFVPTGNGYDYVSMGKVKEVVKHDIDVK